ncbi:hypothetical protein [Vibrio jasicida]|uniref:hypothetical protein n=1 Tax=Vibrio jasicida TaxID=766224 RepID=UPI0005EEFAC8|nr:hypothetical protein [Vibrio jasicida]
MNKDYPSNVMQKYLKEEPDLSPTFILLNLMVMAGVAILAVWVEPLHLAIKNNPLLFGGLAGITALSLAVQLKSSLAKKNSLEKIDVLELTALLSGITTGLAIVLAN